MYSTKRCYVGLVLVSLLNICFVIGVTADNHALLAEPLSFTISDASSKHEQSFDIHPAPENEKERLTSYNDNDDLHIIDENHGDSLTPESDEALDYEQAIDLKSMEGEDRLAVSDSIPNQLGSDDEENLSSSDDALLENVHSISKRSPASRRREQTLRFQQKRSAAKRKATLLRKRAAEQRKSQSSRKRAAGIRKKKLASARALAQNRKRIQFKKKALAKKKAQASASKRRQHQVRKRKLVLLKKKKDADRKKRAQKVKKLRAQEKRRYELQVKQLQKKIAQLKREMRKKRSLKTEADKGPIAAVTTASVVKK